MRYDSNDELVKILVAEIPDGQWPPETVMNWLGSSTSVPEKYEWTELTDKDPERDPLKDIK